VLNIYTLQGMILVEGLLEPADRLTWSSSAPAMSGVRAFALEESSKVSGASNLRTLVRVTLPGSPAGHGLAAATLVIVRSLGSSFCPLARRWIGSAGRVGSSAWRPHIYRVVGDRVCHGLRNGGGGGDECARRLDHADLPLPAT